MDIPKTSTYIETGCFYGRGILHVLMKENYERIHTIELSDFWHEICSSLFEPCPHVTVHKGNSIDILPKLLEEIKEPVTVFLDAHYSGENTARGEEETPLLKELSILKEREFDDVILIDDCRMLGTHGEAGNGGLIYPHFNSDWQNVTLDRIKTLVKEDYTMEFNSVDNGKKKLDIYAPDCLIAYKK